MKKIVLLSLYLTIIITCVPGSSYSQTKVSPRAAFLMIDATIPTNSQVFNLAVSNNIKLLASGEFSGTIIIRELESRKIISELKDGDGWINSISFSPDDKFAATGGSDNSVKLWDIQNNTLFKKYMDLHYSVHAVKFLTDSLIFIAANEFRLVNIYTNRILNKYSYNDIPVISFDIDRIKNLAVLGFANNDIIVLDLKNFHKLKTLTGHKKEVSAISFSPDGKILISGSMDSTLIVWNTKNWKNIKTLKGHKEQINSICFSEDGKFLFSAGWDSKIITWDTKSWSGIIKEAHINVISSILCTKDKLISGSYDKTIKIWKIVY